METDYLLTQDHRAPGNDSAPKPLHRRAVFWLALLLAGLGALTWALLPGTSTPPPAHPPQSIPLLWGSDKVQVELFVMSRCPDALKVEEVFGSVVPAVYSIMDVQLNFIAELNPNATFGATCMHGDAECQGNIEELCALKHKPDLPSFWRFLTCLNNHFSDIGRDADLSLKCASSAGLDTAAFLACTTQGEGLALFKQSVEAAVFAGVKTSATVYIDGSLRCVEDGGWYSCPGGYRPTDFIRDICNAYKGSAPKPSICGQYRPPSGIHKVPAPV